MDKKKILIIKPSSLGDIVHSLPVLAALKKLYPVSRISWVVFPQFAPILENNPCLDEIITWNKKSGPKQLSIFIKELRNRKFDLVIDLQGLARTALLASFTGAVEKIAAPGMKELSWLLVREAGAFSGKMHAVERNLKVIEKLGGDTGEKLFPITITRQEDEFAVNYLKKNGAVGKLIGIAPGAGIWQKRWPEENFSALIDKLAERFNSTIILFGTEKDMPVAEKIVAAAKNRDRIINAAGKTSIKQLCALTKKCFLYIGNDTGPLHIAAALGVTPVGFYGPSNPEQLRPYHSNAVVFRKGVKCSPCGTKPRCGNNICMKEITVEEVYEKIKNIGS